MTVYFPTIKCKLCSWVPKDKDIWRCNCGHCWNTFDTGGLCPKCHKQWSYTACLKCSKNTDHIHWYMSPVDQSYDWKELITLWGKQFWNAFFQEENENVVNKNNWLESLLERIQLIFNLRSSLQLVPNSIEDLYSYYLNNRPDELSVKDLKSFKLFTTELNQYVDRFKRKGKPSAAEYLIVIGAPKYFIENAHVMDERIKQVNRLLNEGGYPPLTPEKTENMLKKLLIVEPKKEKEKTGSLPSEGKQFPSELEMGGSRAKQIIESWMKVMVVNDFEKEKIYEKLTAIITKRITGLNKLRVQLGLPKFDEQEIWKYLDKNPIQFDFLRQQFDTAPFIAISEKITSRIDETYTEEQAFNIEDYLLSAGIYSYTDQELSTIQNAMNQWQVNSLMAGEIELNSLEKEKVVIKYLIKMNKK